MTYIVNLARISQLMSKTQTYNQERLYLIKITLTILNPFKRHKIIKLIECTTAINPKLK